MSLHIQLEIYHKIGLLELIFCVVSFPFHTFGCWEIEALFFSFLTFAKKFCPFSSSYTYEAVSCYIHIRKISRCESKNVYPLSRDGCTCVSSSSLIMQHLTGHYIPQLLCVLGTRIYWPSVNFVPSTSSLLGFVAFMCFSQFLQPL